jgi:hypothetical protein
VHERAVFPDKGRAGCMRSSVREALLALPRASSSLCELGAVQLLGNVVRAESDAVPRVVLGRCRGEARCAVGGGWRRRYGKNGLSSRAHALLGVERRGPSFRVLSLGCAFDAFSGATGSLRELASGERRGLLRELAKRGEVSGSGWDLLSGIVGNRGLSDVGGCSGRVAWTVGAASSAGACTEAICTLALAPGTLCQ